MLNLDETERVLDLGSWDARATNERISLLMIAKTPTPALVSELSRLETIYMDLVKAAEALSPEDREESALARGVLAHVPRQLDHIRAAISQAKATLEQTTGAA